MQLAAEEIHHPVLQALATPDAVLGVAFLLRGTVRGAGRLIMAVRPPPREGSRSVLELHSVGGRVEPSDASLVAAGQREALEEIGCPVTLRSRSHTLIVHSGSALEWVRLDLPVAPVALVVRYYKTPPHEPWATANKGRSLLAVYAAEPAGHPQPQEDLAALAWLTPWQVVQLARRDTRAAALRPGLTLRPAGDLALPPDAWLRVTDAQEALVLALRDLAVPFYRGLC